MSVERFAQIKAEIAVLRAEADDMLKYVFGEAMKGVFDKHPCLMGLRWTQYTPYFNDGDPCVFRNNSGSFDAEFASFVKGEVPEVAPSSDESSDDEDGDWVEGAGYSPERLKNEERRLAVEDASRALDKFDGDDLLTMFDDHQRVTISRTETGVKIISRNYYHD